MEHSDVAVNGIMLHVVEHGEGRPVLFCHGFPDTSRGWKPQMLALAEAGYRSIAVDMRGYGRSSAPAEAEEYTPFQVVGDLVSLLDALKLPTATIVGHDFGASMAWQAALMRPDRFPAIFAMSVPFTPRGEVSFLDELRAAGRDDFYMFDQMRPEADAAWSDAATTIPAALYWLSGTPAAPDRFDAFDASRRFYRPAPVAVPPWADADDVAHLIDEFTRTGFHAPLNYYRALQRGMELAAPFKGALIHQPAFYLRGDLDPVADAAGDPSDLHLVVPGLRGYLELADVGHWPQREAPDDVNRALLAFLQDIA